MNDTNSTSHSNQCLHIEELLSGYLDDELTQQQSQQVSAHIDTCPHCKQSYEQLASLQQEVNMMKMPEMETDRLDQIMNEPVAKATQSLGWVVLLIGIAIALVFALTSFYVDSSISMTQKLIISLIGGGLLGVFLSVVRQQWLARKTDKFKGVKL
jgi:predicted anti-sigma-YlaC factor YlaD